VGSWQPSCRYKQLLNLLVGPGRNGPPWHGAASDTAADGKVTEAVVGGSSPEGQDHIFLSPDGSWCGRGRIVPEPLRDALFVELLQQHRPAGPGFKQPGHDPVLIQGGGPDVPEKGIPLLGVCEQRRWTGAKKHGDPLVPMRSLALTRTKSLLRTPKENTPPPISHPP
jgi:hypothetical protein